MEWPGHKSKLTKISNNLNPVSKLHNLKEPFLFLTIVPKLLTAFTLLFFFVYSYCKFLRSMFFSLCREAWKAIYVFIVDSFTLFR